MLKNSLSFGRIGLHRRWSRLAVIAGVTLAGWALPALAQSPSVSVRPERRVEGSSDLAAALTPAQWTSVEQGIDRGLAWMAMQQRADGSFAADESAQPAVTSLCIMAYLSRGHIPNQGKYGPQISRAIEYVLTTQKPDGGFSALPAGPPFVKDQPSHTLAYNHSIAGLMLGEVYGMTSGPQAARIREAITQALAFSRVEQTKPKVNPVDVGGWRYAYPSPSSPTVRSDLSVTSWYFMFLRSAKNAEFDVPANFAEEANEFVMRCYVPNVRGANREGVFRYNIHGGDPHAPSAAMTGAGMLCLQLGGHHDHEFVRVGALFLRDNRMPGIEQWGHFYYGLYYCSQAMAQVGGDYWAKFFPRLVAQLAPLQNRDGSFRSDAWEGRYSACYCTSLAILSLTPPYQLLPIYQR